jgi:hypothetical protein
MTAPSGTCCDDRPSGRCNSGWLCFTPPSGEYSNNINEWEPNLKRELENEGMTG